MIFFFFHIFCAIQSLRQIRLNEVLQDNSGDAALIVVWVHYFIFYTLLEGRQKEYKERTALTTLGEQLLILKCVIFKPESTHNRLTVYCSTYHPFFTATLTARCRWGGKERVPVLSTWRGWTSCHVIWGLLSCWSEETRKMSLPSTANEVQCI